MEQRLKEGPSRDCPTWGSILSADTKPWQTLLLSSLQSGQRLTGVATHFCHAGNCEAEIRDSGVQDYLGFMRPYPKNKNPNRCFYHLESNQFGLVIAQQLKVLSALPQNLSPIPSAHTEDSQLPLISAPGTLTSSSGLLGHHVHMLISRYMHTYF